MSRTQVWVALIGVIGAVLFHAAFPRYEVHAMERLVVVRLDRWTGHVEVEVTHRVNSTAPVPA